MEIMTNQSIPTINHYIALIKLDHLDERFDFFQEKIQQIIDYLDLKVVDEMSHYFIPQGATFIYVLSQSHIIFHTWPEYDLVHIDLVSCSKKTQDEFEDSIKKAFKGKIKSINIRSVNW